MIGRPKVPLVLTTPEQQALDSLAHRARTAPQAAMAAGDTQMVMSPRRTRARS